MKRFAAVVAAAALAVVLGAGAAADVPENVKTILRKNCAGCHKGNGAPKGLSWEPARIPEAIDAPSREVPALKVIDSATPEASYLLKKIRREKDIAGKPMPPGKALSAEELRVLEAWIAGLK